MAKKAEMISREEIDAFMALHLPEEDRSDEGKRFDALMRHLLTGNGGKPIPKDCETDCTCPKHE